MEDKSWDSWRQHVLAEIRRANESHAILSDAVRSIHIEIAKLQVQAGIWGLIGGIIPVLVLYLTTKFK